MELTPEAPGPWILGQTSGTGAMLACEGARNAIENYLFLGEEIGEDNLFNTYYDVFPVVEAWREQVVAVHDLYVAASKGENLPDELDYQRVEFMLERADFYMEVLERVFDDGLDYQRQEIYTYILRPLLLGLHFESYFDAESEQIDATADYCLPQLFANKLGYTVNYYRSFSHFVRWMFSEESEAAYVNFWADLPSDTAEAVLGPHEKHQRYYKEHVEPVLDNLADIGSGALEAGTAAVKTLASLVKNPIGTAVGLGVFLYWLSQRKRR